LRPAAPSFSDDELGDQAAAEADRDRVGAAARLQLRQEVADVRLDRLLREEEALADLAVHEALRDELEDLDLAHRRLLLELTEWGRERNDLGALPGVAPRRNLVEFPGMREVTVEDVLPLGSVHLAGEIGTRP
jgi:hypothetical protein